MNKREIPIDLSADSKKVAFNKIHDDFSETEYGQKLAGNARYDRYKPEDVTLAEWERLLGVDVNNLKHLKLSYGMARQFIKYTEELSPDQGEKKIELTTKEKEDLLLAATIHDWAEAIVGDVSYDFKTKEHEEKEYAELKKMAGGILGENSDELIARIANVTDTVIKDTNSKLGKIFNMIERVGYVRTALRAWEQSKSEGGDLQTCLQWITYNILCTQILKLVQSSETYPAVAHYLRENKYSIDDAFENMPDSVSKKFSHDDEIIKRSQMTQSRKVWQEFCSTIK